jgi:hypothetical protein
MMRSIKSKGVVVQLLNILPHISSDVERIFFALLFKFSGYTKKEFKYEKIILLDWDTKYKDKEDPDYCIYMQAAHGLWDYIYHVFADSKAVAYKNKEHLVEIWLEWMREREAYNNFVHDCFDCPKRRRAFRRQISIWKDFLYSYLKKRSFY